MAARAATPAASPRQPGPRQPSSTQPASTSSSSRPSGPARARSRWPPRPTRRSSSRRPRWATRSRRSRPACSRWPTSWSSTRAIGPARSGRRPSSGRCWVGGGGRAAAVSAAERPRPKRPEVLVTTASTGVGVPELLAALDRRWAPVRAGATVDGRDYRPRGARAEAQVWAILADRLARRAAGPAPRRPPTAIARWPPIDSIPFAAADRLLGRHRADGAPDMSIERVFVAGAGLMGHGIAQVHAAIGKQVTLYEPELARAEAGRDRIAGNLDRAVAKGQLDRRTARDATSPGRHRPADLAAGGARTSSSRRSSRTSTSRRSSGASSTPRRRRARSSPRTRARSRSIGWPRRWPNRVAPGSSGCTSSARCR